MKSSVIISIFSWAEAALLAVSFPFAHVLSRRMLEVVRDIGFHSQWAWGRVAQDRVGLAVAFLESIHFPVMTTFGLVFALLVVVKDYQVPSFRALKWNGMGVMLLAIMYGLIWGAYWCVICEHQSAFSTVR